MSKLSDKEFWTILAKNGGLFARTARAIEKEYRISYTRVAVELRAKSKPDMLRHITEANIDAAEDTLFAFIRDKEHNPKLALDAAKFYLRTKGKERGYTERSELTAADGRDLCPNIQIEIIDSRTQTDPPRNEAADN